MAVATLDKKKFSKKDFKKYHPSGSLGARLKTVEDLMLTKEKIPFIGENSKMKEALKIITQKKLGVLIARNNKGITTGIISLMFDALYKIEFFFDIIPIKVILFLLAY